MLLCCICCCSSNILITENFTPLLADFGLSQIATQHPDYSTFDHHSGTPEWKAPELFNENACFTASCDVYSYGVIVWEMLTNKRPWSGMTCTEIGHALNGQNEEMQKKSLLDREYFNPDVVDNDIVGHAAVYFGLMRQCLLLLSNGTRPSFAAITANLNTVH
jgi:serine/threonine protein kinase